MDATEQPRESRAAAPVELLYVAFLLVDPVAVAILESAGSVVIEGIVIGGLAGQFSLLAAWAVVGPGNLWVRWPMTLLAAAGLLSAVLVGVVMIGAGGDVSALTVGLSLLPIVFMIVQTPVWILKWVTGCRMVVDPGDGSLPARGSRQFGIGDMLIATTVVAVILGLARMGISAMGPPDGQFHLSVVVGIGVYSSIAAVWNGFVTLPSLYAALVAREVKRGAVVMMVYTILVTGVLALLAAPAVLGPPNVVLPFFVFLNGGAVCVVFGSLLIVRASGYVLLWPGRAQPVDGVD